MDLANLESQVQSQSNDLAHQIREAEDNLMRLKEAYLKVQGAKEMLGIVKVETEKDSKVISPEQVISGTAD